MPAVSFLKAKGSQDGHAGYSSPLDEQIFLVQTINAIQKSPDWSSIAVIIAYDDSDGWYDHQSPPIVNSSHTPLDALNGPGICGRGKSLGDKQGRCGYGPRLPLLVISPYAKMNFVHHAIIDQTSILKFIEENWDLGHIGGNSYDEIAGSLLPLFDFGKRRTDTLYLDGSTGAP